MQIFTDRHHYEQSADVMLAKYTDADFVLRQHAALDRRDIRLLEHSQDGRCTRIRISYADAPDTDMPYFVRRLVPKQARVVQSIEWDLARKVGRIALDTQGSPVHIISEMRLSARGNGCLNTTRWQVNCPILLFGSELEQLLVNTLKQQARRARAVVRQLLTESLKEEKPCSL